MIVQRRCAMFWWLMLSCNLIVSAATIFAGWMMWKHCPQEINRVIGYRTRRSMKNEDTWKFAHDYCGRLWWKIGWIMLVPSAVALIPVFNSSYATIGIVGAVVVTVQCIILIITIFPTERALKKAFSDDGTRR